MATNDSRFARATQQRKASLAELVGVIGRNRVLTRGYEAGSAALQYIQQCLAPRLDQSLNLQHGQSENNTPPPTYIIEKLESYRSVRQRYQDLSSWMDQKVEPTEELISRTTAAMQRLQEKMQHNRRFEGPDEVYNELGQRLEDLQHCLDTIDRDADADFAVLHDLEAEARQEGEELISMVEEWLRLNHNIFEAPVGDEIPAFSPPFDVKIVDEAEAACDQRDVADAQEETELRKLPYQPEDATMSRNWVVQKARRRILDARNSLRDASEELQGMQENRDNQQANVEEDHENMRDNTAVSDTYANDAFDDPEEMQDLQEAQTTPQYDWDDDYQNPYVYADNRQLPTIEEQEDSVRELMIELKESIEIGREIGLNVTDNGTIIRTGPPARAASRCTEEIILWGVGEADDEQELTEEDIAEIHEKVVAICQPWSESIDIEMSPSDVEVTVPSPPSTPTATEIVLTEPQISDSVSQPDHNRIDLGYSVYRNEIDRMDEIRKQMRAELPADAKPLPESESIC